MSDTPNSPGSPGPGWWQASDGNWYPPESHPGYVPPVPTDLTPPPPTFPTPPPSTAFQDPSSEPTAFGTTTQFPVPDATQTLPTVPPVPIPEGPPPLPGQPPWAAPPPLPGQPMSGQAMPGQIPYPGPAGYDPVTGQPAYDPVTGEPIVAQGEPPAKSRTPLILTLVGGVVVLALVAAGIWFFTRDDEKVVTATRPTPSSSSSTTTTDEDTTTTTAKDGGTDLTVNGADTGTDIDVVTNALADIQDYWARTMPSAFNKEYVPIKGGLYAVSPSDELPPCVDRRDQIDGNAFYCSEKDVVAWDDTTFIPDLVNNYGKLGAATVIAHEIGHAIQDRTAMTGKTVTLENQADCYAGTWLADVQAGNAKHFTVDADSLDNALAGFLTLADEPGVDSGDVTAHGNAFDRLSSFQDGVENGVAACAAYSDTSLVITELPFIDDADAAAGGNLSTADILELAPQDLENYWGIAYPNTFDGASWTTLDPTQTVTKSAPLTCGGTDVKNPLFYCIDENYVGYDFALMDELVGEIGDFSAATLLATQWGLAVESQSATAPTDAKAQNLRGDCYAGTWAASVFKEDRKDLGGVLTLSAGDLDEAVKTLLVFSRAGGTTDSVTGFERVSAFRTGMLNGTTACASVGA